MIYKIQYRYPNDEWTDFVPANGHGKHYIREGAVKQVLKKKRRDSMRYSEWGWQNVAEWRVLGTEEPEWEVLDF